MKQAIKQLVGSLAAVAFSSRASTLADGAPPADFLDRLIKSTLIQRAVADGDHKVVRGQLASYWEGDGGTHFYNSYAARFADVFLKEHYQIIEELVKILESDSGSYQSLVEIGCGNGDVLNHLASELTSVESFKGIDINKDIIEINKQTHQHSKISFDHGDALNLLSESAQPGTILLSYGGVMEYFLDTELATMFSSLKSQSPALIVLVEPLYDGFDLDADMDSKPGGAECSFSHNYPNLVKQAGFDIVFQELKQNDFSWVMLIAKG